MLIKLGNSFDSDYVRVKNCKLLFKLKRNRDIGLSDVLIGLEKNVMGSLIITVLLLLRGNSNCDFGCISEIF